MTEPTEERQPRQNVSRQISELEKDSIAIYKSGKYYTYHETNSEYILIIDGKKKDSIILQTAAGTEERLIECIKVEMAIDKAIADKMRAQKKPFLEPYFYLLFEKEKKRKSHETTPTSPLTKVLKDTLTHGANLASTKDAKIDIFHDRITNEYQITYKTAKAEGKLYIPDLEQITSGNGKDITARKILLFILQQANNQHFNNVIHFQLSDMVERGIYKNERTAFKGVKKVLDTFLNIQIEGITRSGRKVTSSQRSVLFTDNYISRKLCTIACKGQVLQFLSQYFMLTPNWIYKLSKKAFLLADYIYSTARQKQNQDNITKNGFFNISFKTINKELKNPEPEETQRHEQFIVNPILSAIDEVERVSMEEGHPIKLTPIYDEHYKNGKVFLSGYLQIELDKIENEFIRERKTSRQKKTDQAIKKAEKIKLAAIQKQNE